LIVGYGIALGLSLLAFPLSSDNRTGTIDLRFADSTIYRTEPKAIVMDRSPLMGPGPSVVMLGASAVQIGFRTPELAALVPNRRVHNLGLGSANVSEIKEIIDLLFEVVPPERRKDLTFVIGLWYGLFIDDQARWHGKPTDLDVEMLRYGLYRLSGDSRFEPRLPPAWLPFASVVLRPMLALDYVIKGSLRPLRQLVEKGVTGPRDLDLVQVDETAKRKALDYWRAQVGSPDGRLKDEQFETMITMLRHVSDQGVRVLLVDLPIPNWHATRSATFADYQQRKARLLEAAAEIPGIEYRSFQDLSEDGDFYDDVHPRPSIRWKWINRLAESLAEGQ
jgi:hypothetical protein